MKCSKCGGSHLSRRRRIGFWQNRIAPLLGFYPWECGYCRAVGLYHNRGPKKKRRGDGAVRPKFHPHDPQPGANAH